MCQTSTNEVSVIRKLLSFLFLFLITVSLLSLTPEANAAASSSKAGTVITSSGRLNVRSQASTNSSVVASLHKGSYVTLISQSGSWWKVEYAKGQLQFTLILGIRMSQNS